MMDMQKDNEFTVYNIAIIFIFAILLGSFVFKHDFFNKTIKNDNLVQQTSIVKTKHEHKHANVVVSNEIAQIERSNQEQPGQSKDESSDDGTLSDEIQALSDEDDFNGLARLVPQVLMAKNKDVKIQMIDSLAWFERKSIPELIPFLADHDAEVHEFAFDKINAAMADGEDEEIASDAALIMKSTAIVDDSEMSDVAMNLNMINDNALIVRTVVDIMANGQSDLGKKWANDTYTFTTGEDSYTTKANAMKWIAENCD